MIRRSIVVRVAPEVAFRVFTERTDLWWPRDHRPMGRADARLSLEPGVGGALAERSDDGAEVLLGRVLAWDPPNALALAFFPGSGPASPTRVDVRFSTVEEGTRVEVEHGPGELSRERFEGTAPRFDRNWELLLRHLAERCEDATSH
ncbi:MAG: SRPBCC domain-containing protein [Alphaproteobacteria bacterium]|nr:SRPBCC domain-containing protein [Alphaproteobacteria bacterium]